MNSVEALEQTTFSGRRFTRKQLTQIQETVFMFPNLSRKELAATLCEHFVWIAPNGKNKTISCTTLLEALEHEGVIRLPKKRVTKRPTQAPTKIETAEQQPVLCASLDTVGEIVLERVTTKAERKEWKDLIRKYHYLGHRHAVGHQIEYFIVSKISNRRLGCISFSGSATWALEARDQWIGWNKKQRRKNLNLIVRNNRFLIFPWVSVPHLASHALSMAAQRVKEDWLSLYHFRPVLLETFVDTTKYEGTCYRASNWQYVGKTSGRSFRRPWETDTIKDIYVYPLTSDFRRCLTEGAPLAVRRKIYRNDLRNSHTRNVDDAFLDLWEKIIPIVQEVADEFDSKWQVRKRVIDSMILILFIFRLVSARKEQSYGTTIDELWDSAKALEIPLPQKSVVAPSSLCVARQKLDENAFRVLHKRVLETYEAHGSQDSRWLDHRLFAVDGSKFHLPRSFLHLGYRTPSDSANYPQGLVSCLYQLKSKIPFDFELSPEMNERHSATRHLASLEKDDVVVYDRGYFSYLMLLEHSNRCIHPIFRLPEQSFCVIQDFFASEQTDTLVTITPSADLKRDIRKERPDLETPSLPLRLLKYTYNGTTFCLGTTLFDPRYTLQDFKNVYHARWGIEELYKVSKQSLQIEEFHAKTDRGVKQELYAHFTLITLSRIFSNHADQQRSDPPIELRRRHKNRSPKNGTLGRFQTNFQNCLRVVSRSIEALLLFHDSVCSTIRTVFHQVKNRYARTRNDRSYPRVSMKPVKKWRSSKPTHRIAGAPTVTPVPTM